MPERVRVAAVGEIPAGTGKGVDVAGRLLAVFHVGGRYYASTAVCPHEDGPLDEGLLVWSAGHDPTRLRFLLPLDTTDEELETGFSMLEKALARVGEERGLPC